MSYLECIAMLQYLLRKLYSEQRQQVSVSIVKEVQLILTQVKKKLGDDLDCSVSSGLDDLFRATQEITTSNVQVLTATMKGALVDGIEELVSTLQLAAFEYFKVHDFEPTESVIPVMRDVVKCALMNNKI